MPFYEIQHSLILTPTQRTKLAKDLTTLHSTTFNAPSLFVNVRFVALNDPDEDYFYGGERRLGTNRIFAFVRSGPSRGAEILDKLGEEIEKVWDGVVGRKVGGVGLGNENVLQGVFIVPGLTAREEGFAIPLAGEEGPWLEENMEKFKERAEKGDVDMKNLIAEVESRPELLKKGADS